jgi:hypothetical protein
MKTKKVLSLLITVLLVISCNSFSGALARSLGDKVASLLTKKPPLTVIGVAGLFAADWALRHKYGPIVQKINHETDFINAVIAYKTNVDKNFSETFFPKDSYLTRDTLWHESVDIKQQSGTISINPMRRFLNYYGEDKFNKIFKILEPVYTLSRASTFLNLTLKKFDSLNALKKARNEIVKRLNADKEIAKENLKKLDTAALNIAHFSVTALGVILNGLKAALLLSVLYKWRIRQ